MQLLNCHLYLELNFILRFQTLPIRISWLTPSPGLSACHLKVITDHSLPLPAPLPLSLVPECFSIFQPLLSGQAFIIFHLHDSAVLPASHLSSMLPRVIFLKTQIILFLACLKLIASSPQHLRWPTLNSLAWLRVWNPFVICLLSLFLVSFLVTSLSARSPVTEFRIPTIHIILPHAYMAFSGARPSTSNDLPHLLSHHF